MARLSDVERKLREIFDAVRAGSCTVSEIALQAHIAVVEDFAFREMNVRSLLAHTDEDPELSKNTAIAFERFLKWYNSQRTV
jgi:hypothetical protein